MLLHGKEIKYLYSGEMGGMNTMVPMLVSIIAKQQGGSSIGLLDFDANGRAVPELNTSLNAARGFAPNPVGLGALPTVGGNLAPSVLSSAKPTPNLRRFAGSCARFTTLRLDSPLGQ